MSAFKWRHFAGEVILGAVRWSCRYGISDRELEAMRRERGGAVDHTTLYRWAQRYAPELEKRTAWYQGQRMRNRGLSGMKGSKTAHPHQRSEERPFPNRGASLPSGPSYRSDLMREP